MGHASIGGVRLYGRIRHEHALAALARYVKRRIGGMDLKTIESIYKNRTPGVIGRHRFYSVLVPFINGCPFGQGCTDMKEMLSGQGGDPAHGLSGCCDTVEVSLLYEVRASGIMQPGEVCFPGGHVEDGESPEECAVRETCEELGISRDAVKVFGEGDTLHGAGFTLTTYIGSIDLSKLSPDPEEVSEVFTVPLSTLIASEPEHYSEKLAPQIDKDFPYEKVGIDQDYPWRTSEHDIPVYDIDGRIIWGMTARITENIVDVINNSKW